jgi:hypothetical protein
VWPRGIIRFIPIVRNPPLDDSLGVDSSLFLPRHWFRNKLAVLEVEQLVSRATGNTSGVDKRQVVYRIHPTIATVDARVNVAEIDFVKDTQAGGEALGAAFDRRVATVSTVRGGTYLKK